MERWSSDHRNAEAESVQLFSNSRQSHPKGGKKKELRADLQDPTATAACVDTKIWILNDYGVVKHVLQQLV